MKNEFRHTIQVGTFAVNSTVLGLGGRAYIIDPGAEADRILKEVAKSGLKPAAILLTHAHFDHIGAVPALQSVHPELKVYVSEADSKVLTHPMNQLPPDYPPIAMPKNLADPRELEELGITVISTPGHTPGGVCYLFGEDALLFSGDTLFAGSIGRTDLPGGNMATLMKSLEALKKLPPETTVIPGHGMFTIIGRELDSNPFLQ